MMGEVYSTGVDEPDELVRELTLITPILTALFFAFSISYGFDCMNQAPERSVMMFTGDLNGDGRVDAAITRDGKYIPLFDDGNGNYLPRARFEEATGRVIVGYDGIDGLLNQEL